MKISQNDIRHFISCNFFLDKKVTKKSRNNDAIPPQRPAHARRFFELARF